MQIENLRTLLERADAEPLGLRVRSNMPQQIINQLCAIRKSAGFSGKLMFCQSSEPGWIFIIHKSVELET